MIILPAHLVGYDRLIVDGIRCLAELGVVECARCGLIGGRLGRLPCRANWVGAFCFRYSVLAFEGRRDLGPSFVFRVTIYCLGLPLGIEWYI